MVKHYKNMSIGDRRRVIVWLIEQIVLFGLFNTALAMFLAVMSALMRLLGIG